MRAIKKILMLLQKLNEPNEVFMSREKKTRCMPTHVPDSLAMHVVEQAFERGWSNSQYIAYVLQLDKKRHEDDLYLSWELENQSAKRSEQNERGERSEHYQRLNEKSPVGATTEPNVQ